jgi:hypothetical protein
MNIARYRTKATDLQDPTFSERRNFLYLLFWTAVKSGLSPWGHEVCLVCENKVLGGTFGAKK